MGDFLTQYQFLDPQIDSIESVLEIRATAMQLYAEGKTILEWGGEANSTRKGFVAPIERILAETRMFLKQADPATYGFPLRNYKVFRA